MTFQEQRARSINVYERFKRYQSVHPVTFRGVARLSGCDHRYISDFFAANRTTLPPAALMGLEQYLTERGF